MNAGLGGAIAGLMAMLCIGPAHAAGWNPQGETRQLEDAQAAVAAFKAADPGLDAFFRKAYGYAVFPDVGKGGFVFAGAFGRGIVFEQGAPVGRAAMTQVTFGAQIGGQTYSEILFFKDKAALDRFKKKDAELSAQASAVIARDGAAAQTSYDSTGVAVFIRVKGGAMLEASIGGQQFDYQPGLGD
jgi:lipid-binding SYLF domain-containing protein